MKLLRVDHIGLEARAEQPFVEHRVDEDVAGVVLLGELAVVVNRVQVAGARRVVIAMEHCTKEGKPKILKRCTLPLTGVKVVNTIVTEMAYISVTPQGLLLEEVAPGLQAEDVQRCTEPKLIVSSTLKTM